MILHSSLQLFTSKHYRSRCRSRWENLDRGQYPFQLIKFVNLVVPSPCETEPYNNKHLMTGHKENSEFVSTRPSMVPEANVSGNKADCFPRGQSLSVLLYLPTQK